MKSLETVYRAGLTAALIVIMVAPAAAQAPLAARAANAVAATPVERVDLLVGRSTVLRTGRPIKRVSLPKPEIADAMVTSPHEVLVHGKMPGTISLLVWGDNGDITTYDVVVRRDLSELEQRVRQLFPGEPILVSSNGGDVVLSGTVTSKYVVDKATSLAAGYVEKPENVVNLLRQQEGMASNQILLRVRFAEVSRSAMQELGASFFTGAGGYKDWVGRAGTQQFAAPEFDTEKGGLVFSDFLNIFAFNTKENLGLVVRALKEKGLFQSLAEPNLVTQNGKEASFLAGGEYPYPVVQGSGGNAAVTIVFKEFGIRLRFTPTVIGNDLVHLKVMPEVSSLDFGNAVTFEGFRVPALSTRRTETEVELRDGQTFAIAGLMDNTVTQTMSKVPGIGDIPILGYLFRSRAYQKNSTELVVMITPQILRRDSTGVTPKLPDAVEPFLGPERKTIPSPSPAFTPQRPTDLIPPGTNAPARAATPEPMAPVASVPVAPAPTPVAPAPKVDSKAEERARREEEKRLREEGKRAREAAEVAAKRQAEEHERQVEEQKKQLAQLKKLQAAQKKQEEEQQKKLAEQQKKAAELQKKAAEQPRPDSEQSLLITEQPAPVDPPTAAETEQRVKKLDEQRAEAERRKVDDKKKAQQRAAKRRALSDPYPPLRSRRTW
jgi:pilus assembly protein CpaC